MESINNNCCESEKMKPEDEIRMLKQDCNSLNRQCKDAIRLNEKLEDVVDTLVNLLAIERNRTNDFRSNQTFHIERMGHYLSAINEVEEICCKIYRDPKTLENEKELAKQILNIVNRF